MKQRKSGKYWLNWDLLADVQGSTEGKNPSEKDSVWARGWAMQLD